MRAYPTVAVSFEVTMKLTEDEAGALDAIAGYSADSFLQTFYGHMGRSYLQPHERGLRSLFEAVRKQVAPQIHAVEEARRVLRGERIEQHERAGAAGLAGAILMAEAIRARAPAEVQGA